MTTMTLKTGNKRQCAHCEAELSGSAIFEEDTGKYFCCDGCRSVYQLINSEGFASFYNKRLNWRAGPVEKSEAKGEYFENCVKTLENGKTELSLVISGVRCAACIWLIETSAVKDGRIESIRVNYANHKARIVFDPKTVSLDEVLSKITRLGYCPLPNASQETFHDKERKDYFYRFAAAAFFSMQLMVYSAALYAGYFQGMESGFRFLFQMISWGLATPVILYSAMPFFKNSLKAARRGHFTMDSLVSLGAGSAYLYSVAAIFTGHETYFDTASMIIALILLGRFIEAGAKQRGGDAVGKLLSLKPKKVRLVTVSEEGEESPAVVVPIERLRPGDYFETEPGTNIAADGRVWRGLCDADESMLTGEPLPVKKEEGREVFAGTKIINGKALIRAEKIGSDTFLSKIAASVEDAQSSKTPIQDVADRFIGKFVPAVLIIALLTFLGWEFIGGLSFSDSLMRAVSVLVIACPCAMGLATPLAVIMAASKLSETGVVFKNGEAVERFARANDFYFDKTGTVTEGRMKVAEHTVMSKTELEMTASAAAYSKHPASQALAALSDAALKSEKFEEIPGKGVQAEISGKRILIGSKDFLKEEGVVIENSAEKLVETWASEGLTIAFVSIDGVLAGIFGVSDFVRSEAREVLERLHTEGNSVTILTGDNPVAAQNILKKAGINAKLYAGISPFKKAEIIKKSPDQEKTVMVGDGLNDAIALTAAAVGVSMGSGANISIESASAVLLRGDLTLIEKAHKICKKSFRIIKENLFWAFSYNLIAIPLAVAGLIHPIMSAVFMSVSSLLVVANSSRIRNI